MVLAISNRIGKMVSNRSVTTGANSSKIASISGRWSRIKSNTFWMIGMKLVPNCVTNPPNAFLTSDMVSPNLTPASTFSLDITIPRSCALVRRSLKESPDSAKIGLKVYAMLSPNNSAAFSLRSVSVPNDIISLMASSRFMSVPSSFFAAFSNVDISTPHCSAAYFNS